MIDILDDQLLTLREACELLFGDKIKPATLRAEHQRGRLEVEKIGRRQFVTRRGIREMRERCRERPDPAPLMGWQPPSHTSSGISPGEALKATLRGLLEPVETGERWSRRKAELKGG